MIGLSASLAACGAPTPPSLPADPPPNHPVDVNLVIKNIHVWDGKIVTVDGWLGICAGRDCAIFSDAERAGRRNMEDWKSGLSIGSAPGFDAKAKPLQLSRVLLKARINDDCFPAKCLDRADVLQPIEIQPWGDQPASAEKVSD